MVEILVTIIIVVFAVYIILKSLKNSSKGKCSCGCSKCQNKKNCCSDNSDKNYKN